ncbi:UNVERIFIED_CONTAM: hypothetical protein HDU68_000970 [Siphonaria sp. JEL0065]|nr:hypothetical protein HDU68_000970 [Siphonaria sp. JEL0065]
MKIILLFTIAALQVAAFSSECQRAINTVAEHDDVCNAKTDGTNAACFCTYIDPDLIPPACSSESDPMWGLYYIFQRLKKADGCIGSTQPTISTPCLTALDALEQTQHACAMTPWETSCLCQYPASNIKNACANDSPSLWHEVYDATAAFEKKVCPIYSTQCQTAFNNVAMQGDVCRAKTDKTNDACFCSYLTPFVIPTSCANDDPSWQFYYLNATLAQGQGCTNSGSVKVSSTCSSVLKSLGQAQWDCANSASTKDCMCAQSAAGFKAACASDPESAWKPSFDALSGYQTGVKCPVGTSTTTTTTTTASATYVPTSTTAAITAIVTKSQIYSSSASDIVVSAIVLASFLFL